MNFQLVWRSYSALFVFPLLNDRHFTPSHTIGNSTSAVVPFVGNWAFGNFKSENMPLITKVSMWAATACQDLYIDVSILD